MKTLFAGLLLVSLSSCSQFSKPENPVKLPVKRSSSVGLSPQPLGFYTERLAQQLFVEPLSTATTTHRRLAIASFLPIRQLSLANISEHETELANQLADSMLTAAVQRGYQAVDIRLRREVLLATDHEQGFSRQLHELQQQHDAQLLLSGTYSAQEDGFIINVRLIDVNSQQVVAAATDYIPDNVMWSAEKMRKRGQHLYRSDRIGEKP